MAQCARPGARLCSPGAAAAPNWLLHPAVQQQLRVRSCGAVPQILPSFLQCSARSLCSATRRRSLGPICFAAPNVHGPPFDQLERSGTGESWDVLGLGQVVCP